MTAGPAQAQTTVDYDMDDDGLIDIDSQAKLDAIRYDIDGDGTANTGSETDYAAGFPTPSSTQCDNPATTSSTETCTGYELTQNLTLTGNWTPIGTSTLWFRTTFEGNGHTISGLTVSHNANAGLFGFVGTFGGTTGIIRNLGVLNASVTLNATSNSAGAIVGSMGASTQLYSSYATGGTITSTTATTASTSVGIGGLVGSSNGVIRASYSTNTVTISGTRNNHHIGGLVGSSAGPIVASYAAGTLSGSGGTGNNYGGLLGRAISTSSTITNSYCDTTVRSGNCIGVLVDSSTAAAAGHSTTALQTPTDYLGIYANWNIDLDANTFVDFPWNFGTSSQYPTFRTPTQRATSPTTQAVGDYDWDDDGLIEVRNQAQLAAIASDLNGDGDASAAAYGTAFPSRLNTASNRMGCPSGTCTGYELAGDLTLTGSWTPIGDYTATFEGNGHTISGLSVTVTSDNAGLFENISTANGVIRNVGLLNPAVSNSGAGGVSAGALVGTAGAGSRIDASYVSGGSVTASNNSLDVGGLVGHSRGSIRASYSTAEVIVSGTRNNVYAGGLVGWLRGTGGNGDITASYAAGAVTGSGGTSTTFAGLAGNVSHSGSIASSYCDNQISTRANCVGGTFSPGSIAAAAVTTSDLQTPTGYTGIYLHWNLDLASPADNVPDYLWNFGSSTEYPTLNTPTQRAAIAPAAGSTDYDADDDGLIDISTAAQLNAVRWDLNGDGDPAAGGANAYSTAFGGRTHTADSMNGLMGCPVADGCSGYELTAALTLTGQWAPMDFSATFNGQGYTISGLTVSVSSGRAGLFGDLTTANGVIRNVGIISPSVTNSAASQRSGALVGNIGAGANVETSYVAGGSVSISGATSQAGGLAGVNAGRIRASYATAAVSTTGNPTNFYIGGLVGYGLGGEITASYAAGAVTPGSGTGDAGGLVGRSDGAGDTITDSYCDSSVMLVSGCIGAHANGSTATAAAHPTSDLQTPTAYAGTIYANWNLNLDGDANTDDDPWDFGTASQYPALKFDTDGNGTPTAYEFGVQGRPAPLPPSPQPGGGSQPAARGGGQPYNPAHAHPEIYQNPRYEMTASCEVVTTGEGDAAVTTSTLTFDLGAYTRPITLVLSLWDGQFFRTLQSQGIPMPTLRQDGQTATVEVVTDPAQTRFRIDSEYGLNLVLGYADCRTDDP